MMDAMCLELRYQDPGLFLPSLDPNLDRFWTFEAVTPRDRQNGKIRIEIRLKISLETATVNYP